MRTNRRALHGKARSTPPFAPFLRIPQRLITRWFEYAGAHPETLNIRSLMPTDATARSGSRTLVAMDRLVWWPRWAAERGPGRLTPRAGTLGLCHYTWCKTPTSESFSDSWTTASKPTTKVLRRTRTLGLSTRWPRHSRGGLTPWQTMSVSFI